MVTITCDKCEKPFTVEMATAGAKVPCPACGDVNVIRTDNASRPGNDRAASLGLPPASGPETTVLTTRGAMFRSAPFTFIGLSLLLIGGLVGGGVLGAIGQVALGSIAAGIGLIGLIILAIWKVRNLGERLEITSKRVVFTQGLLSKTSLEMVYRTIQDIEIKQTFANRIFNVGTMTIANASSDDDVVVLHDIPQPYRIRQIIDAYRPM